MKRAAVLALLLCGCANEKALEATLARLETELAHKQEQAMKLSELRTELESMEARVAEALKGLPQGHELVAAKAEPAPRHTPATLPTESIFEGSKGKRLRAMIAQTEARIFELERVLAGVNELEARRRELQRKLTVLEARLADGGN
jgi:hypothetical protein